MMVMGMLHTTWLSFYLQVHFHHTAAQIRPVVKTFKTAYSIKSHDHVRIIAYKTSHPAADKQQTKLACKLAWACGTLVNQWGSQFILM